MSLTRFRRRGTVVLRWRRAAGWLAPQEFTERGLNSISCAVGVVREIEKEIANFITWAVAATSQPSLCFSRSLHAEPSMSATVIVAFGASFVMPIPAFDLTVHRPGVLASPLMKGNGDALLDIDHAIDERGWLSELKDEIQMQKDYLNQCFEAEECHLEHAQALEDNFSKDLLLRAAKEVSLSEQNARHSHRECLTHMRVPVALLRACSAGRRPARSNNSCRRSASSAAQQSRCSGTIGASALRRSARDRVH